MAIYKTTRHGQIAMTPEEEAAFNAFRHSTNTPEQQQKSYELAIQQHIDEEAKSQGYDSIMSACSYAGDANRFQAQGKAAIRWRADVWTTAETIFADVQAGNRTAPTIEELIAELPTITWPARS